ncbi:MAG: sigma 54-interacting transcriptional regulator, partial [Deltaproteobacteria bacterium]|nr:sigma 54-interacting transcriptional regulator [Deltaproteobacteria bacterium]
FLNPEVLPDLTINNRPGGDPFGEKLLMTSYGSTDISILFLRLRIEGVLQGGLVLKADGIDRFTDEHMRLFALLKDPWAIVMTNNRQYMELVRLKEILADDNQYLYKELQDFRGGEIVGAKNGLRQVTILAGQVASLNSPVLLLGETGVGKEVIASSIHNNSDRKDGPFIKVNCGAIPDTLIDSELFGHEKGAFTGATSQKRGRFERADGGTIFLDEIGELPLQAQVRLLRVIQDRTFERVGGSEPIKVDIRITAATHRDLVEMVEQGSFREDLYYRLNVFPIRIPPLRHRKSDITELTHYFIHKKAVELGRHQVPELAPGADRKLVSHHWPGNVRELENAVERALITSRGAYLEFSDLAGPDATASPATEVILEPARSLKLDDANYRHIESVMAMTEGRVEGPGGAADLLGLNPGTLRARMRKLGMPFGRRVKG